MDIVKEPTCATLWMFLIKIAKHEPGLIRIIISNLYGGEVYK